MTPAESLAIGCAMNARGSTEIIVASIGLSMGMLNQALFTTIVTMAVVTTMSMPPFLRWALTRLPITPDEAARLEREEFEAAGFISQVERLLVTVDASPSGQFASRLIGLLAGGRRIPTTVIHFDYEPAGSAAEGERQAKRTQEVVKQSSESAVDMGNQEPTQQIHVTNRVERPSDTTIVAESKKGYGLLFIGREPASEGAIFHDQITQSAAGFAGPFAIAIARGMDRLSAVGPRLNILVPVTGTLVSRRGAELAIALAQASQGTVTTLHVSGLQRRVGSWPHEVGTAIAAASSGDAIIRDIVQMADRYGVEINGLVRSHQSTPEAILRQLKIGNHNLLIMGVSPRPGEQLYFGQTPAEMLARVECSVLFIAGDPSTVAASALTHSADS
jgi:nucleotide-binding universal stress UspA family protein